MTLQRLPSLHLLCLAIGIAFFLEMPPALIGQSNSATLGGSVADQSGAMVSGATIWITNVSTNVRRKALTNPDGQFLFPDLEPGSYALRAQIQGFAAVEAQDLILHTNDVREVHLTLKVGAVSETVTVNAAAVMVNTSSAVSTVIDRQFVDNLPVNGRTFQTLIELSPGVVVVPTSFSDQGQFSVNGQRNNANYFTVDGVSANFGVGLTQGLGQEISGSVPAGNVQGGFSNLVSVDALQEFKIQTSSFAPEFGRMPGGQIALTSRSGQNKFHGSLYDYFRNDATDAKDWFDLKKPPLRFNDFGGTLGGPILRDKTFFFFSYEGQRFLLPQPRVNTVVPSQAARAAAPNPTAAMILNAFPQPNGAAVGTYGALYSIAYSNPNKMNSYSIRIDHNLHEKYSFFMRYVNSPSETSTRQTDDLSGTSRFNRNTETITLGSNQEFTGHLVNELRLNVSRQLGTNDLGFDKLGGGVLPDSSIFLPDGWSTDLPRAYNFSIDSLVGSDGLGANLSYGNTTTNRAQSINVVDDLTFAWRSHELKFGFDYRGYRAKGVGAVSNAVDFSSVADVDNLTAFLVLAQRFPTITYITPNYSAFAQDTWKINHRLTVTYGLRWEINPSPGFGDGVSRTTLTHSPDLSNPDQSGLQLAALNTPYYRTGIGKLAPRIGGAYEFARTPGHETVLRGGWGLVYDLQSQPFAGGGWPLTNSIFNFSQTVPLTASQLAFPPLSYTPSPTNPAVNIYVASPGFTAPRTYQWNFTVEQSLGNDQILSLAYVGAAGRDLLHSTLLFMGPGPNNPAPGVYFSSDFSSIYYADNASRSDYNSMQVQYQRRLARGFQALANYTWSHSTDDSSSASSLISPGYVSVYSPDQNHGASSFDVRHNFSAGATYEIPASKLPSWANAVCRDWSVNTVVFARSGLPFDVETAEFSPFQALINRRVSVVPGVPIKIFGNGAPGGWIVNPAAFAAPASPTGQGDMGRNSISGFGSWQADVGLHRTFNLKDQFKAEFRMEMFNITNHPNFFNPNSFMGYDPVNGLVPLPFFGQSTSTMARGYGGGTGLGLSSLFQQGGPRSTQFSLRLSF